MTLGELGIVLVQALERLTRGEAVGPARVDSRVHLVVEPGHAHHVELVEVLGVDREELHTLEQGRALVLRQLQHALVELQPRELAVHEQLGRIERRSFPWCGYRFHLLPIS